MILERMGIDIHEVVDAASTKPFGFSRFDPGPVSGGTASPLTLVSRGRPRAGIPAALWSWRVRSTPKCQNAAASILAQDAKDLDGSWFLS